eukprot:gene56655-biopygen98590
MTPLLLWNVRGLMAKQGLKLAELQAVMMKEQAELVVLTETHLDEAFTDEQISASGYQTLRVDREPHPRKQKLRQRGGVLVFAHESRTLSKITTRQGSDFELLAFDDDRSGKRYIAIYRRPGPSVSWDLLDALDEELQQADHPVVLGDLNMNTLAQAPQPRQLHTLLKHKYSLQQRIPFVTRPPTRPNGRGSQIDHIWAKHPCRCSHIPQLSQHSDHRAVRMYCASLQPSPQKRAKVVWRRRWDKVEGDDVRAILEQVMPRARLWSHMPEEAAEEMRRNMCGPGEPKLHRTQPSEVKGVVDRWDEAWTRVKTELAPKQRVRVKTTTSKFPWITKEVRAAMRERNQLQRRSTAQGATAQDRAEYQTARADTERQYKRARREYITKHWKKCSTGKGFNKEHWRFLNRVMGRKASIRPEPKCSPDALNESFLAKVERIRAPLESEPQPAVTELSAAGRLSEFRKVTADEVLCVLGRIRGTRSVGIDEVPMTVLKRMREQLSPYIAQVTNAVSVEGWPPQWKKAEVIPLWKKKGSRSDPGVYRPIALLPAISRVVEKMLSIQIKDHIREVGALPAFQHGYQPGRSCETAVAQLVDLVASARDKGDIVLVASADCSAAFDTVSHDILLRKLERACGIQGKALELMHSYLGGRRQRVRMSGDRTSQWRHTSWGVPQGSVWGPLMFALYTSDIAQHVTAARLVVYADDITLVVSSKDADKAKEQMETALSQLEDYCRRNRIAPEPTKTQLMLSGTPQQLSGVRDLACVMGKHKISPERTIKVLGVLLDEKLSWEEHGAKAARKAHGAIWAVARASSFFSIKDRAAIMRALALPHLDFCQTALAEPSAPARASLRRMYNKAARVSVWGMHALTNWNRDGSRRILHSAPALKQLRWSSYDRRRAAVRASFTAKVYETGEPAALRELLPASGDGSLGAHRHV